jgi:hypothetical protein
MATITEDQTIARHMTNRGFSIAIIRNGYSGGKVFQVVRANEASQYITIHNAKSEQEARKLANKEWLADMGRGQEMIY